ncbi:concanavalin a-like lectins glucanase protein [Rutstroemia sp. NJR-2017a BVV2]|nr:concanavalin a-like lectins glucanase protein [Rutstroemia sp. NJR-2017a BVV2]
MSSPASFLIDFAAQQYGMLSTPNMKDIHDANLSFWSPQPYAIALFFFPQQIFQLVWLYRLWKLDPKKSEKERRETEIMTDFVPFYALGNLCIASWMIFWNTSSLKTSNIFVLINSFTQLYYIFGRLGPMNTKSTSSIFTHVVAKTFAGIGVLDLLHNGSVAYFDHQGPNTAVKVLTGVGFGALASMSDWIFGGCLVYDLIALAVGQRQIGESGWSNLLGVYALGTAGLVGLRNWARPPYVKGDVEGYEVAPGEEEV